MADIVQIIKYEGDNSTFVWKSPVEDFNTGTQLIVHESQEALFFMNGQALDLFGPGRHTLETQNIPLIRKFLNKPTNDQTPFHCEVYFINKTDQSDIRWGTDSLIQFEETKFSLPISFGASGTMILRAEDARKLLVKFVGTEPYLGNAQLVAKLKGAILVNVKSHLGGVMRLGGFSIINVDEQLAEFSSAITQKLAPEFAEYGLTLVRFFVERIAKQENDENYRFLVSQAREIAKARQQQNVDLIGQETDSRRIVMEAQALAAKRQLEGYTYQQEQSFEVSKFAAQNEGAGNFSSAGIGLGMMGGIAGGLGASIAGITTNAMAPVTPMQPPSAAPAAPADEMAALRQKIEKLKLMKESGLLSDEEFDAEKKKIIGAL